VPEIVALFAPIGLALGATHAAGLVHRDFKPDNVMIDRDGWPWLLDFGLTRAVRGSDAHDQTAFAQTLTRTGAKLGTRGYVAPEQLLGRDVDGRADQFSFCVALYESLCGRLPFSGATHDAVALAAVRGAVDPFGPAALPKRVQRAILRGLAPDPEARFPAMEALVDAL
jgi:serine/threonine protein kinase